MGLGQIWNLSIILKILNGYTYRCTQKFCKVVNDEMLPFFAFPPAHPPATQKIPSNFKSFSADFTEDMIAVS